jgi:hypothetical protein
MAGFFFIFLYYYCTSDLPYLRIYLKEFKPKYNRINFMPKFIAALFMIVKLWKQSRFHTTDERIKKVEYYSAIKKNEIMPFAGKCGTGDNCTRFRRTKVTCSYLHVEAILIRLKERERERERERENL